jgi:DNA repair protein RadC
MEKIYEIQRIKQVRVRVEVEMKTIRTPDDAARIATQFIGDDDREVFLVMCLNTKNNVVAVHRAHVGALNSSLVNPREVYKSAILNNSASIIVAHQHPSSEISPSREDINVTERLAEAGKILSIELLDHLIVNDTGEFTSLKEKGYI